MNERRAASFDQSVAIAERRVPRGRRLTTRSRAAIDLRLRIATARSFNPVMASVKR
jgi:hypothetical protein